MLFLLSWWLVQFFLVSSTNPGAIKLTKAGIKSSTTNTINNKPKNNKLKTSLANLLDFDLPFYKF